MGLNMHVHLKKRIPKQALEKFILEASKEMGLSAKVSDVCTIRYELDPVREVKEYVSTNIKIKGKVLPLMTLNLNLFGKISGSLDTIHICTGVYSPVYGFASKSLVERYLSKISKKINETYGNQEPNPNSIILKQLYQ